MLKGGTFVLILGVIGLSLLAAGIGGAWEQHPPSHYAPSTQPVRPGQEDSIKRAVFARDRLWLLSDSGVLWTVRQAVASAERQPTPETALDLCVQEGRPIVVTAPHGAAPAWTLRRWDAPEWTTLATAASEGDGLVAVQCAADHLILLTTRRLIEVRGARRTTLQLTNRVPARPLNTTLTTPTHIFLGLNAGEWGGGLQRIDRRTGQVMVLESNVSGGLCGGPLNPDCDPVNGVAAAPWKPGCVVAAIGLVHMRARGRVVEICGDQVNRVHLGPCPSDRPEDRTKARAKDDEPACTEAFFGLIQHGESLMAVGTGGLTALGRTGLTERTPLPIFRDYGPFAVNFDHPEVVLVRSSANQRHSLSGAVPLAVAR